MSCPNFTVPLSDFALFLEIFFPLTSAGACFGSFVTTSLPLNLSLALPPKMKARVRCEDDGKCYKRNPQHWAQFSHNKQEEPLDRYSCA